MAGVERACVSCCDGAAGGGWSAAFVDRVGRASINCGETAGGEGAATNRASDSVSDGAAEFCEWMEADSMMDGLIDGGATGSSAKAAGDVIITAPKGSCLLGASEWPGWRLMAAGV